MPVRSVEYGEEADQVVVLGQLAMPDLELIRDGLSRGPGGNHVVTDLRHASVPDTQTRTKVVGISRTRERLLAHLGVDLAADGSSRVQARIAALARRARTDPAEPRPDA
jgi:hypothetical protein